MAAEHAAAVLCEKEVAAVRRTLAGVWGPDGRLWALLNF
jgi:hypothetical protein